ncbi:arginase [Sporosarcina sp. PTS2304]|uniref:arginase n=1 Tax=Sporosarcina sp. PTS2304 TaxID=2283194 RepID=UPI000E0CE5DA|nr:arginase [Sporosarcina sp. PTS2304]AXI00368.1 arginase [Sporosarcina sp. PTS2304]
MRTLDIMMIGVPVDLGQSRRGVDMGPSAIRYAGAVERLESLGHRVEDCGNIAVSPVREKTDTQKGLKNLSEVTSVSEELATVVSDSVANKKFPLILGGDHSIAIGTLAGLADHYSNLGVIWYDAHADMNTSETSPSGNIHGMPLAVSIGLGHDQLVNVHRAGAKIDPKNIVIIGARALDPGERQLIKEKGVTVFTMHEIDRYGMSAVIQQTLQHFEDRKVDGVHLSLDLDGLDPLYTPGVGTPVPGGITYRESHLALELLEDADVITSAEFVEVNPILDEYNKTADVAVGLIGSLFGEKLL